jgi:XRE family transcriptional regulator, regulator of sulfur utilization
VIDPGTSPGFPIGLRIRELRLERGMTLDQLSRSAGISASHLSRLERGQAEPSFTVAAALASQLEVSLTELLDYVKTAGQSQTA